MSPDKITTILLILLSLPFLVMVFITVFDGKEREEKRSARALALDLAINLGLVAIAASLPFVAFVIDVVIETTVKKFLF